MNRLLPACIAEFIGTFALVFFGCASIIVANGQLGGSPFTGSAGLVTIALAHGLILAICISGAAYISGGQFNPAVAIGLVVAGKQPAQRAAVFVVVQLIAAACAAGVLQLVLSPEVANSEPVRLGATIGRLTDAGMVGAVVMFEAVATFFLMFAVLAGTVDDRAHKLGGFVIGLTLVAAILAIGPLTGASLNPARTFGPAVCGSRWDMHLAYWLGPVIGACVAAVVYKFAWEPKRA